MTTSHPVDLTTHFSQSSIPALLPWTRTGNGTPPSFFGPTGVDPVTVRDDFSRLSKGLLGESLGSEPHDGHCGRGSTTTSRRGPPTRRRGAGKGALGTVCRLHGPRGTSERPLRQGGTSYTPRVVDGREEDRCRGKGNPSTSGDVLDVPNRPGWGGVGGWGRGVDRPVSRPGVH